MKNLHKKIDTRAGTYLYIDKRNKKPLYLGKGINLKDRIYKEIRLLEKGSFTNKGLQDFYNKNKQHLDLVILSVYKRYLPTGTIKTSKTKKLYNDMLEKKETKLINSIQPLYNIKKVYY